LPISIPVPFHVTHRNLLLFEFNLTINVLPDHLRRTGGCILSFGLEFGSDSIVSVAMGIATMPPVENFKKNFNLIH
jgi:hypothetical protein